MRINLIIPLKKIEVILTINPLINIWCKYKVIAEKHKYIYKMNVCKTNNYK